MGFKQAYSLFQVLLKRHFHLCASKYFSILLIDQFFYKVYASFFSILLIFLSWFSIIADSEVSVQLTENFVNSRNFCLTPNFQENMFNNISSWGLMEINGLFWPRVNICSLASSVYLVRSIVTCSVFGSNILKFSRNIDSKCKRTKLAISLL